MTPPEDAFLADADEQMTVGIDCCPHYVPYGSDCDECDEDDADMAMGMTPNVQAEGAARLLAQIPSSAGLAGTEE